MWIKENFNVKWCENMGTKGTRFSISKPNQRDSLAFVTFATIFHLNPKPRCTI